MENKYYTPTIEEFHVGFEYEHSHTSVRHVIIDFKNNTVDDSFESTRIWTKAVFSGREFDKWYSSFDLIKSLADSQVRVKYLDKEDIESLDWKIEKVDKLRYKLDFTEVFSRDNWILVYYTSESILPNKVIIYNDTYTDCIFKGIIKNKSELIKVLKMLEIYGK